MGAGIFALLGAAGEVAGAAVWVSFLIAGSQLVANAQTTTAAHFRVRSETGANAGILAVAIAAVLVTFVFTTLIHEPASMITLLAVLLPGAGLDAGWTRARAGATGREPVAH